MLDLWKERIAFLFVGLAAGWLAGGAGFGACVDDAGAPPAAALERVDDAGARE